MSLRDKISKLSGVREYKTLTVDGLGEVRVRSLTEGEWQAGVILWFRNDEYERIPERTKYDNAKLIQMCLVELDSEELVFSDSIADLDAIVNLRESITHPIYQAAYKLNRPELPKN